MAETDKPSTSFLMARAKAAKARATEKPSPVANKQPAATEIRKPPQPQNRPTPQPAKPNRRTATPNSEPNRAIGETTEHESAKPVSTGPDEERILALFSQHSPNGLAFEIAKPHLPDVMRAILHGAKVRGPAGHQDRMTLFRMLGAPWTPTAQLRSEQGQNLDAFADRLVAAVARRERILLGRSPVTVDATFTEEPAPAAA